MSVSMDNELKETDGTPFEPEDPGTFYPLLPEVQPDQEVIDVLKARQQLRERKRRQWLLGGHCYQ